MGTIVALPSLLLGCVLFVSGLAYNILRHPDLHGSGFRIWNYVATDVYFLEEANIWQNKPECVEFDELLLYRPSLGCSFSNPEFTTQLEFSKDGRKTEGERNAIKQAILLAGDSVTMGWGVNDNETFGQLIASQINGSVFNLGVSSYGTVREILFAQRHSSFPSAKCIVLQYSWNDLEENLTFVTHGDLPQPTPERFQQLFDYRPRQASFLDVLVHTQKYVSNYPVDFLFDSLGLRNFPPWQRLLYGHTLKPPGYHLDLFINVLKKFPELNDKTIFVVGPDDFIDTLASQNSQKNIMPLKMTVSIYPLDRHPNKRGHQEIAAKILEALQKSDEGRQC
jgi:lysophospholipase L1-like esterase